MVASTACLLVAMMADEWGEMRADEWGEMRAALRAGGLVELLGYEMAASMAAWKGCLKGEQMVVLLVCWKADWKGYAKAVSKDGLWAVTTGDVSVGLKEMMMAAKRVVD